MLLCARGRRLLCVLMWGALLASTGGPLRAQILLSLPTYPTQDTVSRQDIPASGKIPASDSIYYSEDSLIIFFKDSTEVRPHWRSLPPTLPRFQVSGIGGAGGVGASVADNPSARIMLELNLIRPESFPSLTNPRLTVYAALNKGAGLEAIDADTFDIETIVFPEASDAAATLGAELSLFHLGPWEKESRHEFAFFLDYSLQRRTVNHRGEDKAIEISSWNLGPRYIGTFHSDGNDLRFSVSLHLPTTIDVTDATEAAYQAVFQHLREPAMDTLPQRFLGWGLQVTIQYNSVAFQFEYRRLSGEKGMDLSGVTGGKFIIKTAVLGKLFSMK